MTDETYEHIREFLRRNTVPGAGTIPVYVSDEVPDDEPELSEGEYALGIRLSPNDHADLRRRLGPATYKDTELT